MNDTNPSILSCNNCEWAGWATEAVHPKHVSSQLLCPECNETTEIVTPKWFADLRDEFDRLLGTAEQALEGIDFDNRKVVAFAGLRVLKNAVDFYREENGAQ